MSVIVNWTQGIDILATGCAPRPPLVEFEVIWMLRSPSGYPSLSCNI